MANSTKRRAGALCGIVSFALVAGCAQTPTQKAPARPPLEPIAHVRTPEGWVQERNGYNQLVSSRDGYPVQFIFAAARNNLDAFPVIKKSADQGMLPSQVAELHIANLKANSGEHLEVLENEPAELGDLAG